MSSSEDAARYFIAADAMRDWIQCIEDHEGELVYCREPRYSGATGRHPISYNVQFTVDSELLLDTHFCPEQPIADPLAYAGTAAFGMPIEDPELRHTIHAALAAELRDALNDGALAARIDDLRLAEDGGYDGVLRVERPAHTDESEP